MAAIIQPRLRRGLDAGGARITGGGGGKGGGGGVASGPLDSGASGVVSISGAHYPKARKAARRETEGYCVGTDVP